MRHDIWRSSTAILPRRFAESSSCSHRPKAQISSSASLPNYRFLGSRIMKVTDKDVVYVAELANLELTEEERAGMLRDLNSILEYVDRLDELDTSEVPPMAQVSDRYGVDQAKQGSARFAYASREDVVEGLRKSLPREEALANAPDADEEFFRVPKVIER